LATDPAQAGLVRGIFWSILFLLSMPFLIFATLSGYFYWLIRRARAVAPASVLTDVAPQELPRTSSTVSDELPEAIEV
jgi:hypothetical protein